MRLPLKCPGLLLVYLLANAENRNAPTVASADGIIQVQVHLENKLAYSVSFNGQTLLGPLHNRIDI